MIVVYKPAKKNGFIESFYYARTPLATFFDVIEAANYPAVVFTANEVFPNLWVGSAPPPNGYLTQHGFDAVVLCAVEFQPPNISFSNITVAHAPMRDSLNPTAAELGIARVAANWVATQVADGKNVLVTCRSGFNRSALVAGLAMSQLINLPGYEIVKIIQANRRGSLTNETFAEILNGLG